MERCEPKVHLSGLQRQVGAPEFTAVWEWDRAGTAKL